MFAGGIAVVAVGQPFDTLKVRLQTQPSVNPIYCESCNAWYLLRLSCHVATGRHHL